MKNFKKLTLSSLVLAALSSSAVWAENDSSLLLKEELGSDKEYNLSNGGSLYVTSGNEDNTRITFREDKEKKDYFIEIETATPPLRYTNKDNTNNAYVQQDQFQPTDYVTLIGGKTTTSSGVVIHNVGEGRLEKDGKQAVNGGQLFKVQEDLKFTEDQRQTMSINLNANNVKLGNLEDKVNEVEAQRETMSITLNSNNVKIGNLEEKVAKHDGQLETLEKRADDTDSKFEEVVKGFESVNNTIATNDKATREAFEGVGEAFKGVATRLNGHGEQLTALDKRTTDTNTEVTAVKTTVAGLDKVQKEHTTKLDTLTGRADAADAARQQISVALSGLEGRLSKTDTTVGTLATQLNDHGVKLNALDKKIASVDKKAQQGIAAALAVAALPQAVLPNESVVAFGAGNWRSENGVAIGVSHASGNGKWLFKVGAVNAGSNFGANAGIGYCW
ncbi:YadA-like family protein [Testudinibacter sp. P27/CKL/0425]